MLSIDYRYVKAKNYTVSTFIEFFTEFETTPSKRDLEQFITEKKKNIMHISGLLKLEEREAWFELLKHDFSHNYGDILRFLVDKFPPQKTSGEFFIKRNLYWFTLDPIDMLIIQMVQRDFNLYPSVMSYLS